MPQLFRYKKVFLLVLVTIVLLWTINLTSEPRENASFPEKIVGFIVVPVQRAFNYIHVQFNEAYAFFYEIGASKDEKEKLSLRVMTLEDKVRQLGDVDKENERLRQLLGLKSEYKDYDLEFAQVIGRNSENWNSIVTINKGSNNGLKVNTEVLSANKGLVGKVIEVAPDWSKVMLITDTDSSVSSMIDRTRDLTVIRGDADAQKYGYVKLTYLLPDADVVAGDIVTTSGNGGIFSKGILIGKVTDIKDQKIEAGELIKYVYVEPAADLKRIEEVFVIKK